MGIFETIKDGVENIFTSAKDTFQSPSLTTGKRLLVVVLIICAAFWLIGKTADKGE